MEGRFFEDVEQRSVEITGGSIQVPIFYQDVFAIAANFMAPTLPLKDLLPTSELVPVEILPGKGLITFIAFDYHASSIGPYRELGMAIPVRHQPRFNVPLFPALRMAASLSFEAYVWQLPITSEVGLNAGMDIWGYPKFMAEIEFSESEKSVVCSLSEKGEHILTLEVGKPKPKMKSYFDLGTYSVKDDELLFTPVRGLSGAIGRSFLPGTATLSLGEHPLSRSIREVAPGKSIQTLYLPKAQIILPQVEKRFSLQ